MNGFCCVYVCGGKNYVRLLNGGKIKQNKEDGGSVIKAQRAAFCLNA